MELGIKTPLKKVLSGKAEDHHSLFWYPSRCEHQKCDTNEHLKRCGGCNMVQYCSIDHQKSDWPFHKADCATFKRLGVKACFYTDSAILARFPLRTNENHNKSAHEVSDSELNAEPDHMCTLCGRGPPEVPVEHTECCQRAVCNTEESYQMFSYSREHCARSHRRYTLCGHHGVEPECHQAHSLDWRTCSGCVDLSRAKLADTLWRGLNAYNFLPLLARDVPRHSMCDRCSVCSGSFMCGVEGGGYSSKGTTCPSCSGMSGAARPGQITYNLL